MKSSHRLNSYSPESKDRTRRFKLVLFLSIASCCGLVLLASSSAAKLAGRRITSRAAAAVREIAKPKPPSPKLSSLRSATQSTNEPTVSTDKLHYEPGDTVLISGSGFRPNERVVLQVKYHDQRATVGSFYDPWDVYADGSGAIRSSWIVDPEAAHGSWFEVRATGADSGLFTLAFFTDPANADLDQCANGKASAPVPCTLAAWQNGNVNENQAHYREGDSVPYRMKFDQLTIGATNTLTISYDTTKNGKHALDYLTTYDRTENSGNNPCSGVQGCSLAVKTTAPIPSDPRVAAGQNQIPADGDDITQIPGVFTLFGGTITGVSAYTVTGSYAGDSTTSITITFTSAVTNPVMAWGGHIGTRLDWGLANSAISITGSPYHMRLEDLNGSGGNQDRSLSASAVFFPISLTIVKETNPDNAQSKTFNYTTTGPELSAFSLTPPSGTQTDSKNFILNDDSNRSVTESDPHALPPQFDLTGVACSQTDGGGGVGTFSTNLGTRTVSFSPKEGQSITCTFTNTEDLNATRGRIIVDKVTNPSGDLTSFDFNPTYGSAFSLTDAAAPNNSGLITPGNYSVSETVPGGWDKTSSCVSSIGDTETEGALDLDAGETITCTFTNTKRGHIIVDKVTNPSGDPQSFNFDASGGSYADFSLTDAAAANDQTLVPGNYSVSETVPSGWDKTGDSCVSSIGDTEASGALELDPGETITCTFTNTKRGHIIVDKVTYPSGDPQSFNFDGSGGSYADFSLTDAAAPNDQTLVPGNYSVSETVPSGWDKTGDSCVSSIGDTETSGALELDPGETITCTFRNTKRGHIIVDKITDPSGDPQSFNFDANGGSYADFSLTDAATPNDQTLVPGSYSVSETVPAGWDLTSSPCTSSKGDSETAASISLQAGETVTCRFYNRKRARLIVEKQTDPDGATGSFTFTGTAAGTISDGGNIPVGNLVPGTYTSTENNPNPNFDLTSIVCTDGNSTGDVTSRTATFRLEPGETVKCTFTNRQRGMAKVIKTFNGGALGANTFTFQLRSGASAGAAGTILESLTANAGNGGVLNFTTKLVPGQTYQMCEQMQAGWLTTLGPPLYSVFNPSGDNSVVCTDFTVAAAETKTFTINNQPPPGGMALTIGYWKNWASCANSNGGQKPTLDRTVNLKTLTYGSLVLTDTNANPDVASICTQLVALLNKTTIGGGNKKMASDPIFNMVAQLVAADLNGLAGAGVSVNAMAAINCAHALLAAIHFNGNTYDKPLSAAQINQANCLATQLDRYNNNQVVGTCAGCP